MMSLLDQIRLMPDALCERRPAEPEPEPEPRAIDGRRIDLGSLFVGPPRPRGDAEAPPALERRVIAKGPPLQHVVGVHKVKKHGRPGVESRVPQDISRSEASTRLDALLDLGDHAELATCWSLRYLTERLDTDARLQAELLLRYFWGPEAARSWALRHRPDVELEIRMPPLLGWVTFDDLASVMARTLEGRAEVFLDLEPHRLRAPTGSASHLPHGPVEPGNLATPLGRPTLASAPGVSEGSWTRSRPPVLGPAPLVAPVVKIRLDEGCDELAEELGLRVGASSTSAPAGPASSPGWALAKAIAQCYVPIHVGILRDVPLER